MVTVVANDIIRDALRLCSSATPGEAINGDEATDALRVLNRMLASYSAEWGLINIMTVDAIPLVVGKQNYTYGTGGDINSVRPDTIFNQWLYDTVAGIYYPISQITDTEYWAINLKSIQSIPKVIYYNPTYPLGNLYVYPTAGLANYVLSIESFKPMAQFSFLNSTMNLPGEYYDCLVKLLTEQLAPEYGYPIPADLQKKIDHSRDYMKARNFKPTIATFDNYSGSNRWGTILDGFITP